MRWDPLLTKAMARELDARLTRARVRGFLMEPEARRLLLYLREGTLSFDLHPLGGWIRWSDPVEPLAGARPLSARIRRVYSLPDESVLGFGMRRVRGAGEGVELLLEFFGNRWNALVVDAESRTVRHVLHPREEKGRSLRVGARYRPPPPSGRSGPPAPEAWAPMQADTPPEALLRTLAGASSLNLPLFRTSPLGGLVSAEVGIARWRMMTDRAHWGAWLLDLPRGPQPYPIEIPGVPASPFPTLLDAMAAGIEQAGGAPLLSPALSSRLLARAEARRDRLQRKCEALERQAIQAVDPETARSRGDLLLARFREIPKGADRVTLLDFSGEPVDVELDPALPPHENARRYYDEAARLERIRSDLPGRLAEARAELARWDALRLGVQAGEIPPERLEEALGPEVGRAPRTGSGGEGNVPPLPYRRYRSSGGLEIRVGKGARQNDLLTFHHASPGDLWLHVREAPGAHVILRWSRIENPPRRDLEEAAILAALSSDARHAQVVPVDWTRRKHVRKPRKAPPGSVVPERVQTLFVEPDPEVEKRLRVTQDLGP
jgi:predicted ribosome quality control (RQC) complex YloA/Tae2 family protein